ncbi:MAG: Nif3-like dinuclear metal center hexameric protein [Gemmatimonadota bacterium]|nr:Nif3-like dinuclear metal center hexameric protein [Gemmatimonadota bacterium]
MDLESLVAYLDDYLGVVGHPDYADAHNGLQVWGTRPVGRVGVAVDASEATLAAAIQRGCDVLVVHHGLFWGGAAPLTGRRYRKAKLLLDAGLALYSAHLPLDAHPEVGNSAVLARALGVEIEGPFGDYKGASLGWYGRLDTPREMLTTRIEETVGGAVRLIGGGPARVRKVAVVTGGGGSLIGEAARAGMDALITGEGAHHTYFDAMELGVNVYYAGHYATETWGVRALALHLETEHGLAWEFLDFPTGL